MPAYSPFIQLLYDQPGPVGDFGRGSHYSILRAAVWQDAGLKPLSFSTEQDFALIWDEDHDERVTSVLGRIYRHGLLSPILFLGERKGILSIIISEYAHSLLGSRFDGYQAKLQPLAKDHGDSWPVQVTVFGDKTTSIINDKPNDVDLYLRSINLLWKLGHQIPSSNAA